MNRVATAKRLIEAARELLGMEFPSQDALDKYLKDHPDADRSNHRVVETKKETTKKETTKDEDSADDPKGLLEKNSDKYHVKHVLPALRNGLSKAMPEGVKLRGRGRVEKGGVEMIADVSIGDKTYPVKIGIHGSYMTSGDGEYNIVVSSPYFQGTHDYHDDFSGNPEEDAKRIQKDLGEMMEDVRGFLKK